jgi:fructose-bisphosphate aldolase class I
MSIPQVLSAVFQQLLLYKVSLPAMLLKPNMVVPGAKGPKASPETVAASTLRVLRATVPPAVPGIMFLSGGQSEDEATHHLELINKRGSK